MPAAGGDDEQPLNVKPIGQEPAGATPIEDEELEGLIPNFVATRADLNQVEYENIARHLPDALRFARANGPDAVLDYAFMLRLHRAMFGEVWRWAGTQRRRITNIGIAPELIAVQSVQALDDARFWHLHAVFNHDELAARVHGRLVNIHPFPNGNGRCTRLIADLYLASIDEPIFTWGAATLDTDGTNRQRYLDALLSALNSDDYGPLVAFARS